MIDQGETHIIVQKVVAAGAAAMFELLTHPRRHVEVDGSGMLRAAAGSTPVTGVGQIFTMAMNYPSLGDYRTDNHVIEFEPGRRIAWMTGREGQPPAGVCWTWEFEPTSDGRTRVTHTYDWSSVTDPAVLGRVSFPRVPADRLRDSVDRLAQAAR